MMLLIVLVISSRAEPAEAESKADVSAPLPAWESAAMAETGLADDQYEQLESTILQLAAELIERQQELQQINSAILELEDLIAAKEDAVLDLTAGAGLLPGVELGIPEDVVMAPIDNQRVTKQPCYVEVTAEAYIAQPGNRRFPTSELNRSGSTLRQFLDAVDQARQKEYLVFLIHPNGVSAYKNIQNFLNENFPAPSGSRASGSRIQIGKEPFSRNWQFVRQQDASP